MITARRLLTGAGLSTAALAFGGTTPALVTCTETYNGTAWSAGGALASARYSAGGAGTNTAALTFGGFGTVPATGARSCTETYNGTAWSAGGALITARYGPAGAGTNTAGLAFGGVSFPAPTTLACSEIYNGSSWSTGGAMNRSRTQLAGDGASNTAAFAASGQVNLGTSTTCTEVYCAGPVSASIQTFNYSNTTGVTTVSSLIETSAHRYKHNVQQLSSQLYKINQLNPVEFDWKLNEKHDIGFIAEEVQEIYPELVNTNDNGEVEGLSYSKMISALVKGMQEQQQQLNSLIQEINNLKNK